MAATMKKTRKVSTAINWIAAGLGKRFDSEIAKDLGVQRRQVTKVRARLGIPAYSKSKKAKQATQGGAAPVIAPPLDAVSAPSPVPIAQQVAAAPLIASPGLPRRKPPAP